MGQFRDQLHAQVVHLQTQNKVIFDGVVEEATRSIVEGSEITGAPGQPVKSGQLKASWHTAYESPLVATISSPLGDPEKQGGYGQQIEDGTREGRALTLRSKVGGFHSVALTIAGMNKIVETVTAKMAAT